MNDIFFSCWAIGSFNLLKMFWLALVGFFAMVIPCGCTSLLVVLEMFLMYGSVILLVSYATVG